MAQNTASPDGLISWMPPSTRRAGPCRFGSRSLTRIASCAPGLFVRVTVPAVQERNAIRIPQQAVQELQGLKSVYVVDSGNKAEPRQIEARYRVGTDWLIENGLIAGERVVVEGTGKLRPGAPVKPVLTAQDSAPTTGEPSTSREAKQAPAPSPPGSRTPG
jgi:membrane fusion protein (multidrug efflux system)